MIGPLRPQPPARSVVEPWTAPFGLLARYFQPLPSSNPPDPLDVYLPAFVDQQLADPSIPVPSVLRCQPLGRRRFIIADPRSTALRRPRLADNRTNTAFRAQESRAHVLNALACGKGSVFSLKRFLQDQLQSSQSPK
jgi:hypothetical protein